MRALKTILSILHRGFDKIKQDGRVMVLDEKSAEKLYNQLRLVETDEGTYMVAFENDSGTQKDILSSGNNKKRSHTQLDSRKQVIAFQDRVITINIKEAQHPLK